MGDPNETGIKCPHCLYDFDLIELPWVEGDSVDECPNCELEIYIQPQISVTHKIAKNYDEIDFVDPI